MSEIQPPPQGPEDFLSHEERQALQRSMSFPEDLPSAFKSWMIDYMGVNIAQIPISQVVGFDLYKQAVEEAQAAIEANQVVVHTVNLQTQITAAENGVPSVTAIPAGTYVVFFGVRMGLAGSGTDEVRADLAFNGVADTASRIANGFGPASSVSRAYPKVFEDDNNTIAINYSQGGGSSPVWQDRWITAMKIGPAS